MALEMLTNTHLSLYGKTMAIIGSEHGIQLVRRIMVDIFVNNQLPALWIKKLMVMRELQKMPELKDQPWEQFLPKVRKGKGRSKARVSKQKKSGLELVDVGKYSERKTDKLIDLGVSTKRSAKNKGKHNFKKQQHK